MSVLNKIIPIDNLKLTIKRFPFSTLCCLALFTLTVLNIHNVITITDNLNIFGRLLALSIIGYFWFGFIKLVAQSKLWSTRKHIISALVGIAVFTALVFSQNDTRLSWLLALTIPALILGIAVAPYLSRDRDNNAFWVYNVKIWQGVAISILVGLLWGGGISAALSAIDTLFNVGIPSKLYEDLWALSLIIFAPLYALSWVPQGFIHSSQDARPAPHIAFILNWVSSPLTVIYMLILYAYLIKIVIAGNLPSGQLAYMITAFGGIGVLSYIGGWVMRNDGGPFLKLVQRFFFPALIIPVIMQAISIYQRIAQYGITEDRYIILISTLWFALLAILFTIRKPSLKIAPALLALLLILAAFGPFSAPHIALSSQMKRLTTLLSNNNMLVDNRIVAAETPLSFDDRKNISSILDFLERRNQLQRIEPWIDIYKPLSDEDDMHKGKIHKTLSTYDLAQNMGFDFVGHYQSEQTKHSKHIQLNGHNDSHILNVRGYRYLLSNQHMYALKEKNKSLHGGGDNITTHYKNDQLTLEIKNKGTLSFDIKTYALEQLKENPSRESRPLILEKTAKGVKVRLILHTINIHYQNDKPADQQYSLSNFSFDALIGY